MIFLCAYVLVSEKDVSICLCKKFLHLLVDILAREAELLVEHFVGSTEAEALKTPYSAVCTYQTFEVDGQTSGQAELLLASGQHALLILL